LFLIDLLLLICSELGLLNLSLVHGLGWRRGLLVNWLCSGLLLDVSFFLFQKCKLSLFLFEFLLLISLGISLSLLGDCLL